MVAMVIGLLLLAGISQVFLSNKQTYRLLEAQSHVQENGRFAFEFLARDVRMADFWGCQVNTDNITDHLCHTDSTHINYCSSGVGISSGSYAYDWQSDGIFGTDGATSNDPDTLILRGAFDSGIFVEQVPATPAAALKVTDTSGLVKGDLVLVTDCQMGEFFSVTDTTGPSGFDNIGHNTGTNGGFIQNKTQVFNKKYGPDASVYKFGRVEYYIGTGMGGEPALFRRYNVLSPTTGDEIVSGIENMQIEYGVDTGANGNVDYYEDATEVTNQGAWDNVVSVRITLTARSPERYVVTSTTGGADRRLRREFTSTMAVRNRLN